MATRGKAPKDRGLGRGLSALMSDISPALGEEDIAEVPEREAVLPTGMRDVPTHRLTRNPAQPRLRFDKARLAELASSLKERGVLQPILVRPLPARSKADADYQIVAGERRFQAALSAKIETVPVIVRELSDQDVLEIGVIENVQRANLNPMEEARAYKRLADEFGRRHEDIARAIGKSRAYVSNAIRLTGLPEAAQEAVMDGKLTAGHARAILSADDPHRVADAILSKGLSVREAERMAKPRKTSTTSTKSPETVRLEREVEDALGAKAVITESRGGKVSLKLSFASQAQAEAAIRKLTG